MQEEQPHGSEALQTAGDLCWELDGHSVQWSGKQCCADGVTNTEHFVSVYIIFILSVINLPRFLSHVLEWTSHCDMFSHYYSYKKT